jgi:uncharacterized protein (TIGR02118 family)
MYKLFVMYKKPADPAAFEKYYFEVHLPLARRIPGLARLVVNRGIVPSWGVPPEYYLIAELHFKDEATFNAAMASPESAATSKDVGKFAADLVTMMVVREE